MKVDPTSIEFWFIFGLGAFSAGLFILMAVLLTEERPEE